MDDTPPSTRKAIGTEPGLPGTVTARVDLGGLDEWPTDIADCAMQAGVTLPPLKPVGAPIAWTMTQTDDLAVQSAGQATVLDETGSARFRYATTQESVETSKGDPVEGELKIHRPVDEVFAFVADERNEPPYNPRLHRVQKITPGPVALGTVFRAETTTLGRTVAMTIEITAYERPNLLASHTHLATMDIQGR